MVNEKIGVITFHEVYNYGAVIQAYALQKFLDDNGFKNEIVDFSPKKQKDYTNIYSIRNGFKRFIKTLMLTPANTQRIVRKKRFDNFLEDYLTLSQEKYEDSTSLEKANENYQTFIVGSDQVWNVTKKSDTSSAYFLRFVGDNKKRIAYAPSIGNATLEELKVYREDLKRFNALSCREKGGSSLVSKLVGSDVKVVLDPTLLIDRNSLLGLTETTKEVPYILYYSLDGYDKRTNNMDILLLLKRKFGLALKIVTPEWPFHKEFGEDIINAGPKEFLSLIKNAEIVCTNSFHGTALAIKFERPLYVLEEFSAEDERKRSILEQLKIENRNISSIEDVKMIRSYEMDYTSINKKLKILRDDSSRYLINALIE